MVLGPSLVPVKDNYLRNQTPGMCFINVANEDLVYGLQRALDQNTDSASSVLCDPRTSHLASQFSNSGWGCGYLNALMLLSYIQKSSPQEYQLGFGHELPSIRKIQTLIQEGWSKGIRPIPS